MHERVGEMLTLLHERNGLGPDDIISVFVTATQDIRCMFPAASVRAFGLDDVPLLGAQELDIDGGLPLCVRVMLHVATERSKTDMQHVYLHGARALRADLADEPGSDGDDG